MQTVLVVAELLVAAGLIIFVLLQRSEGGGLGMGSSSSGGMGGLFSPRGAADTLTRTTAVLATLFFVICIGLNLMARHAGPQKSILESTTPATSQPAKPAAPLPLPAGPTVPKPQ